MTTAPELIVVGAGITGSEAALACARAGLNVLLITTSLDTVYNLVGEAAVLEPPAGTLMAELCSPSSLTPSPVLNEIATFALHRRAKRALEGEPNLHLLQSSVSGLLITEGRLVGISTWEGVDRFAPRVALCVGSFLQARLRIGDLTETSGRLSEMAYDDLYDELVERGFALEGVKLSAPSSRGALPYAVACQKFAASEWDAVTFGLMRVAGLYAAGVCTSGSLPYEAAARQGLALSGRLLS